MLGTLLLLFIVLPATDLFLLMKLAQWLGLYQTLIIIVTTGFAGAILYRTQSWLNMRKMQETMARGQMPDKELIDSILIIAGAILLVTPGVITDGLGFLVLLPITRPLVRKLVVAWFRRKVNSGDIQVQIGGSSF
ncbi:MAG: FxsA family protein [Candidatus Nanohaloarchaea archaeon]|nr:FxsA family protein [Candidatus Nanohaloarchaea archaeon]